MAKKRRSKAPQRTPWKIVFNDSNSSATVRCTCDGYSRDPQDTPVFHQSWCPFGVQVTYTGGTYSDFTLGDGWITYTGPTIFLNGTSGYSGEGISA